MQAKNRLAATGRAAHRKMTGFFGLVAVLSIASAAGAQTLKVHVGGQQRPDVMRQIFRIYEWETGQKIVMETGDAASDVQHQTLSRLLTAKDSSFDILLIDSVRPAQYAAAGWLEPLDASLGPARADLLKRYLPGYLEAATINGKLMALPGFADALFLYYRTDLLQKYGLQPPATWEALISAARTVLTGEQTPTLVGFSFQGGKTESTTCSFLVPFWEKGGSFPAAQGKLTLSGPAGRDALQFLADLSVKHGLTGTVSPATTTSEDTRQQFAVGNLVFAQLWGYGWSLFEAEGSPVRGKVGILPLPAFSGGKSATCLGGWYWSVSAFSKNKAAAAALVQWLSGPRIAKELALRASVLPALPEVYQDAEVLAALPWLRQVPPILQNGRVRPASPRYAEISDIIQTGVSSVLTGQKTPDAALAEMDRTFSRLPR